METQLLTQARLVMTEIFIAGMDVVIHVSKSLDLNALGLHQFAYQFVEME